MASQWEGDTLVLHPTLEEFEDFKTFVEGLESEHKSLSIVKVVPPQGWQARSTPYNKTLKNRQIRHVRRQNVELPSGSSKGIFELRVGVPEADSMSIEEFKEHSNKIELERTARDKEAAVMHQFEQVERTYWSTARSKRMVPLCGELLGGTLFDAGGSWSPDSLNSLLTDVIGRPHSLTDPTLSFGMWRSVVGWHLEDMNCHSLHYLHTGTPRLWYTIPPSQSERFEATVKRHYAQQHSECDNFLAHQKVWCSPALLKDDHLMVSRTVQLAGEFVIIFPQTYWGSLSLGFNVVESTRFGTEDWLTASVLARHCKCVDSHRIDMAPILRSFDKANLTKKVDVKDLLTRVKEQTETGSDNEISKASASSKPVTSSSAPADKAVSSPSLSSLPPQKAKKRRRPTAAGFTTTKGTGDAADDTSAADGDSKKVRIRRKYLDSRAAKADGLDIFLVEQILDKKIEDGRALYLIRWKGFDASHDSWEPSANITMNTVADYEKQIRAQKMLEEKGKSAASKGKTGKPDGTRNAPAVEPALPSEVGVECCSLSGVVFAGGVDLRSVERVARHPVMAAMEQYAVASLDFPAPAKAIQTASAPVKPVLSPTKPVATPPKSVPTSAVERNVQSPKTRAQLRKTVATATTRQRTSKRGGQTTGLDEWAESAAKGAVVLTRAVPKLYPSKDRKNRSHVPVPLSDSKPPVTSPAAVKNTNSVPMTVTGGAVDAAVNVAMVDTANGAAAAATTSAVVDTVEDANDDTGDLWRTVGGFLVAASGNSFWDEERVEEMIFVSEDELKRLAERKAEAEKRKTREKKTVKKRKCIPNEMETDTPAPEKAFPCAYCNKVGYDDITNLLKHWRICREYAAKTSKVGSLSVESTPVPTQCVDQSKVWLHPSPAASSPSKRVVSKTGSETQATPRSSRPRVVHTSTSSEAATSSSGGNARNSVVTSVNGGKAADNTASSNSAVAGKLDPHVSHAGAPSTRRSPDRESPQSTTDTKTEKQQPPHSPVDSATATGPTTVSPSASSEVVNMEIDSPVQQVKAEAAVDAWNSSPPPLDYGSRKSETDHSPASVKQLLFCAWCGVQKQASDFSATQKRKKRRSGCLRCLECVQLLRQEGRRSPVRSGSGSALQVGVLTVPEEDRDGARSPGEISEAEEEEADPVHPNAERKESMAERVPPQLHHAAQIEHDSVSRAFLDPPPRAAPPRGPEASHSVFHHTHPPPQHHQQQPSAPSQYLPPEVSRERLQQNISDTSASDAASHHRGPNIQHPNHSHSQQWQTMVVQPQAFEVSAKVETAGSSGGPQMYGGFGHVPERQNEVTRQFPIQEGKQHGYWQRQVKLEHEHHLRDSNASNSTEDYGRLRAVAERVRREAEERRERHLMAQRQAEQHAAQQRELERQRFMKEKTETEQRWMEENERRERLERERQRAAMQPGELERREQERREQERREWEHMELERQAVEQWNRDHAPRPHPVDSRGAGVDYPGNRTQHTVRPAPPAPPPHARPHDMTAMQMRRPVEHHSQRQWVQHRPTHPGPHAAHPGPHAAHPGPHAAHPGPHAATNMLYHPPPPPMHPHMPPPVPMRGPMTPHVPMHHRPLLTPPPPPPLLQHPSRAMMHGPPVLQAPPHRPGVPVMGPPPWRRW